MDLAAGPYFPEGAAVWLSPDECERAARFFRREDRDRFIRSHQALRRVLAGYLGRSPKSLRFRTGPAGKPELDGPDWGPLRFNLSHSGWHALIGISDGAAIGADIEVIRPVGDPMAVARAHFHTGEISDLARLPAHRQVAAFLACWTRKEAVMKALGTGLGLPLDSFRVSLPPAEAILLRRDGGEGGEPGWSMHHLDPGPDVVGAVAIMRSDEPCTRYRLAQNWTDDA